MQAQTSRQSDWRADFVAVGCSRVCVGLLLARLDFLCVYCVPGSLQRFPFLVSSNMTLVLLCTRMVRVKRRVGRVLFLWRVAKGCRPTVECADVVEFTRLKQ